MTIPGFISLSRLCFASTQNSAARQLQNIKLIFFLDIEFEGWIQRPNRSIPLPRFWGGFFYASWYKYTLDLQKFLITMMSVSQNIICSAAELSHTCSISAPDGWVHNKFSSWSLDWKAHIKNDFLVVFWFLWGSSSQWVFSCLPPRTELLVFTWCSSPPYPFRAAVCFPLEALSFKPAFCSLSTCIWPFQEIFPFPKNACLYLHPGSFPTFIV